MSFGVASVPCSTDLSPPGPFLESPGNFSSAESCFVFFIQDQSFNNFENNAMKLYVNEAKLTGLWARNWVTILTGFDLKFA